MSSGSRDSLFTDPSRATVSAAVDATARATVDATETRAADPGASEPRALKQGGVVGRYVVLQRVGTGGNGAVYSAYDPKLDRRVALKLLRETRRAPSAGSDLLVEAQAMARLSHPHVVSVHDVGEHEGQVFVAMEFVDGSTLAQWLREAPRRPPEILEVFVAAGRGLAAAHDKRLVHRDFKPENVLVDDGGRVLVSDFGLAQALASLDAPSTAPPDGNGPTDEAPAHRFVGTPAYAAPEQYEGGEVGAAADQFSFCVALYEALYGERPFEGETAAEIAYHVMKGQLREAKNQTSVAPWIRRVLVRGLAQEPAARHESMRALLHALTHDPRRRRRLVAAGVVVATLVPVAIAANAVFAERSEQRCAREASLIDEDWNDETRRALTEAMHGSGVSFADETSAVIVRKLDAFAEEWEQTRASLCREALAGQDRERVAASVACLDAARRDLEIVTEVLGASTAESVRGAAGVASLVNPPHLCIDSAYLERNPPPLEDDADIRRLGLDLTRARALVATSQWDEARELAQRARVRARDGQLGRVEASALVALASIANEQGRAEAAAGHAEEAFFIAAGARADATAAAAAARLAYSVGYLQRDFDRGLHWVRLGMMWEDRGTLPLVARSDLLNARAVILEAQGDLDRARDDLKTALDIRRELYGPTHPRAVEMLLNLANLEVSAEQDDRARELYNLGRPLAESALGTKHALTASFEELAGHVAQRSRDYETALEHYAKALEVRKLVLGPRHPAVAVTEFNIGSVQRTLGDLEAAAKHFEIAFSITEELQTEPNIDLFARALWLAEIYSALGRDVDATRMFDRAVATERAIDLSGLPGAVTLLQLSEMQIRFQQPEASIDSLERSLEMIVEAGAERQTTAALVHASLAWKLLDSGRLDRGRVHLDQALDIAEATEGPVRARMLPVFVLAGQAELLLGNDARAREFLVPARDTPGAERSPGNYAATLNGLGELEQRAGRLEPARELFEAALAKCREPSGTPDCEARSEYGLARVAVARGDAEAGELHARRAQTLLAGRSAPAQTLSQQVDAFVREHFEAPL